MRAKLLFILFTCLWTCHAAYAQDSVSVSPAPESVVIKKPFQPDAKRAGLYSALLPGLGQIYNRQYWKLPIIYAGVGTAVYFIAKNSNEYNRYRKAYVSRLSNNTKGPDEFEGILSTAAIKQYQDDYKKYLDLTVMLTVVGYAAQIMEAITAAHLKNFDVSQNITLQFRPVIIPNGVVGVGLVMNF